MCARARARMNIDRYTDIFRYIDINMHMHMHMNMNMHMHTHTHTHTHKQGTR